MSRFFSVLLSSGELAPASRWRLVDRLFGNLRPSIEGCGAVAIVAIIGLVRSGEIFFIAALAGSALILALRIQQARFYARVNGPEAIRHKTPEFWARQFMLLSFGTASLWGVMNFAAFRTGDPILQIFVVTVQSGWLGAGCVRNAASPAAAFWQLVLVLVPCMICLSFSHDHILHALVPFAAIQFSATSGIAHSIGSQITGTMISEQRLEAANARLTELSATDGLTGIANRRAFDAALTAEWGRAARDGTDLGLLVIDVDYFKAFNDHYGHPAGDECLRLVAALTARTLRRPPDTAARFGGEEFVALLPGTSALAAMEVAERVRCAIMESGVLHQASVFGCVTVSIGAASLSPHPGSEAQMLIDLADKALYRAKDSGRNTVRCASDGLEIGLPAWSAARERAR